MPGAGFILGAVQKAGEKGRGAKTDPNKLAEESISTKNVKLPKRKKLPKFHVKEHNYNIEKSR